MKFPIFFSLLSLAAIPAVLSTPTRAADEPAVEAAIRGAGTALQALDDFMSNTIRPHPDQNTRQKIENAISLQKKVVDELRRGARQIKHGPSVAVQEQIKLSDWGSALTTFYKRTMDEWISIKQFTVQTGQRNAVLDALLDLSEATVVFSDAYNTKANNVYAQQGNTKNKKDQLAHIERAVSVYRR